MSLEKKILSMLSDGCFHSGSALGAELGVSRTAIWKGIQQINTGYGLTIQAVQGRGYRLERPLELLDKQLIEQHMIASTHQALSCRDIKQLLVDSSDQCNSSPLSA